MDIIQLADLARRDLERALKVFLENWVGEWESVLEELRLRQPLDWPPDLLPMLEWLYAAVEAEGAGWLPEVIVPQLLQPESIVRSPLKLEHVSLRRGDELTDALQRRLGRAILVVGGEGDLVLSLDSVEVYLGANLGYASCSGPLRGRRVTVAELTAVGKTYTRLQAFADSPGVSAGLVALFQLKAERLLLTPNQNLPASLKRLEAFNLRQRSYIWREILEYLRRLALSAELRPQFVRLMSRLEEGKIAIDRVHVLRLLGLAAQLQSQVALRTPVELNALQATLQDLADYVRLCANRPRLERLVGEARIERVNELLLRLGAGLRGDDWDEILELELVDFRDNYLKKVYSRGIEPLMAIDPAELIRQGLERNRMRNWPELGEPERVLNEWVNLDMEIKAAQARLSASMETRAAATSTSALFDDVISDEPPPVQGQGPGVRSELQNMLAELDKMANRVDFGDVARD